jgi:hypothetical protein
VETEALRIKLGLRRLTDAERAAKGMAPYDVDRAYAEFLGAEPRRKEEKQAKERDERDPAIAKGRAEATRVADAAAALRPSKLPRVEMRTLQTNRGQAKGRPPRRARLSTSIRLWLHSGWGRSQGERAALSLVQRWALKLKRGRRETVGRVLWQSTASLAPLTFSSARI